MSFQPTPGPGSTTPFSAGPPPKDALAGFWRRFGGLVIDAILVGIVAGIIGRMFGINAYRMSRYAADGGVHFRFRAQGPSILLTLIYFTYFHATAAGQSIGNLAVGVRVLDADTGSPLTYGRAFVRALMSYISGLALLVGYLWMLWDPRKQTWHDKVANSLVVRSADYPPPAFGKPAAKT